MRNFANRVFRATVINVFTARIAPSSNTRVHLTEPMMTGLTVAVCGPSHLREYFATTTIPGFRRTITSGGSPPIVPGLSEGPFRERMEPMARPSKYSPELRERAVRLVLEHAPRAPLAVGRRSRSVAEKLGCTVEALRRWVRQAERDDGQRVRA